MATIEWVVIDDQSVVISEVDPEDGSSWLDVDHWPRGAEARPVALIGWDKSRPDPLLTLALGLREGGDNEHGFTLTPDDEHMSIGLPLGDFLRGLGITAEQCVQALSGDADAST